MTSSSRRWVLFAAVLACLSGGARAEQTFVAPLTPERRRAFESIKGADIVGHARVLSDPAFRGRSAGGEGARAAAAYVAEAFVAAGLSPGGDAGSYYQVFKIRPGYEITGNLQIAIGTESVGSLKRGEDYMPVHLPDGKAQLEAACAFAGYGIESAALGFNEYAGLDVKGKAVVVFTGTPWGQATAGWLRLGLDDETLGTLERKARSASAHGASCLLVVENPAGVRKQVAVSERLRLPDPQAKLASPIPIVQVTRRLAAQLMNMTVAELRLLAHDIMTSRQPESMPLRGRTLSFTATMTGRALMGRNIAAILPGRDPDLRREAVVLGAHYDHLGEMANVGVLFGANDNAAGVGSLLCIARAAATMPSGLKRSIVFVAFDAEEIGRLGSTHYVECPSIPITNTVFMINFDMVGKNGENHIHAVGTRSSEEIHRIHQHVNRHIGLDITNPASYRLGRSDHTAFYYARVPIMYLFGGIDDEYNTPEDTWEKLIPGKLEKVARLALLTACEAADLGTRPVFRTPPNAPTSYLEIEVPRK